MRHDVGVALNLSAHHRAHSPVLSEFITLSILFFFIVSTILFAQLLLPLPPIILLLDLANRYCLVCSV